MDSETYWARRAEEREKYWYQKCRDTIDKELAAYYVDSLGRIQTDIAALYGRFAKDNKLTAREARKLLKGSEYRQWRMSIDRYVKKIRETDDMGLEKELNTLAMRSRISRLDKLYGETLMELQGLGEKVTTSMKDFLSEAYKDNYYHGVYDIAKAGQLRNAVSKVDTKALEDVLRYRWSGMNYSERIWKNQRFLAYNLRKEMIAAVHRGESIEKVSSRIAKRMDTGISNARRLVRTELNYVNNHAALDSIDDSGMKYYRFTATLDSRTSAVCRAHDGHVYPISEARQGTNVPPLHPNCRSTISGSLRGEGSTKTGTRAARNGLGKTIFVPANMKYDDWKAVYIDRSQSLADWLKEHAPKKQTKPAVADIMGIAELKSLVASLDLKTCTKDDVVKLGEKVTESFDIVDKIGDKEALKDVFSNFREMGGEVPDTNFAKGSFKQNKAMLREAFSYYPKAWADFLEKSQRKLYTVKSERGFFHEGAVMANGRRYASNKFANYINGYVTINMDGKRKTTPYHEIGHYVEFFNRDALRMSLDFVKDRTRGEALTQLRELFPGWGYDANEKTRADDFISPYIGKDYGTMASEVLSIGLESLFEPGIGQAKKNNGRQKVVYANIKDDKEFLHLIVGLILKA